MNFYFGKLRHEDTKIVFNQRKNEQDISSVYGVSIGMTFIGVMRLKNTIGPVQEGKSHE